MQIKSKDIQMVAIKDIKMHPKNPNKHSDDQIKRLCEIIKYQGFRSPLIVSTRSGFLISGHGRLLAANKLNLISVPVMYQDYESEDQEYASLVSENSIASWAELDLSFINTDVGDLGPDFDIDLLGIKDFVIEPADKFKGDADAIPETPKEAICKPGDLWQLGSHRLLCGDSTIRENIERLMNGEKADMVFTDPPYGIGLKYNTHNDSEEKWYDLINKIMPIAKMAAPFILMPCCRITSLPFWYEKHTPDWIMCWYKGSPGHRSHIGFNDWEPHLVWGKPKNPMHDYWQTECGFEIDGHPCPKPVAYVVWVLDRAINSGDKVLDLFLGSGTTLIGCEKTNRKCYGMEIDPHYCDVIIKRWEIYTGKTATRIPKRGKRVH